MQTADVMTREVATVLPEASLVDAVQLMLNRRISGLPVVDGAGQLIGMITQGDLLRRVELGTEGHHSRWAAFIAGPGRLAQEYVGSHGRKVGDVMTRDVVSVEEATPLEVVVTLMERHKVRRLPVMRDGRMVGLVSRADLLRPLVQALTPAPDTTPQDRAIRDRVMAELARHSWAVPDNIDVTVTDGVVELDGTVSDLRQTDAIRVAAENVPGVRSVNNKLVWVEPNAGLRYIVG